MSRARMSTILKRVPRDLFKFTTADENGGLGESVGADLRAASNLTPATAATERDGHPHNLYFHESHFFTEE